MAKNEFPIFKTKIKGLTRKFNLSDPKERLEYFHAKAGNEIERLKNYLDKNTFIGYMLAKKGAGKGTYAGMLKEIFGSDKIAHLSVGDLIRSIDEEVNDPQKRKNLEDFLKVNYRGFHSLEQIMKAQESRSTKNLLPTEFILALLQREISRLQRKAIFLDGFPRNMDQVSYSLFFRSLIGYRDDPDFFVLIQVPESVIDERLKFRVVCPDCQMSRNLKLLPTEKVGHDASSKKFFLKCENPSCREMKMVAKEGDELGIENIRERLENDEKLIDQTFSLYGIPRILLRNSIPVKEASEYIDDYEITPEYVFKFDQKSGNIKISQKPWVIKDDNGIDSYSLLAPPVVVSFVKQLVEVLGI